MVSRTSSAKDGQHGVQYRGRSAPCPVQRVSAGCSAKRMVSRMSSTEDGHQDVQHRGWSAGCRAQRMVIRMSSAERGEAATLDRKREEEPSGHDDHDDDNDTTATGLLTNTDTSGYRCPVYPRACPCPPSACVRRMWWPSWASQSENITLGTDQPV
ncbi:hypothetical protein PoB_006205800 [Plakobranchus ocellatus]|uniref:Uncharacterized protein n=1 Tax=Plakobranchus ocellatus TaxID=259542 RepID=A0AAV4CUJ5_9GAST|nr:hypothetical protein PoB_006205800 [Plakobranchus ocellatus]